MAVVRASLIVFLGTLGLSTAWASDYQLQDFGINTNGSVMDLAAGGNPYGVGGVVTGGFDKTTGLGTLTYTFDPGAAGTYNVGFFVDQNAAIPLFNEYGIVGGSPAAGTSYQIDESAYGAIYGNFKTSSFDNKNDLPGQTDNFNGSCTYVSGGTCNGDVALGMGFHFTLTAKQEAVFTLVGSTTTPGGFYLEDVHPVDAANTTASEYFLTGSELIKPAGGPPPPPTPEPASEWLAGGGLLMFGILWPKLRHRLAGRN